MDTRTFRDRRRFEAVRMPEVRQILSGCYPRSTIKRAPDQLDEKRATDLLITMEMGKSLHCAVRVRQPQYIRYWPNATFRSSYPEGQPTEWGKIKAGDGDIMFYGIWDGKSISKWVIMDLNKVRDEASQGNVYYAARNRPDQGGEGFHEIKPPALCRVAIYAQW